MHSPTQATPDQSTQESVVARLMHEQSLLAALTALRAAGHSYLSIYNLAQELRLHEEIPERFMEDF